MILRDMLSAGIAIYDEYPDMYNHVIKMMFKDYLPVRNYIYSGHNYHQGTSYVMYVSATTSSRSGFCNAWAQEPYTTRRSSLSCTTSSTAAVPTGR